MESATETPATWNRETLLENLRHQARDIADENAILPFQRILLQVEQEPDYVETLKLWDKFDAHTKVIRWKRLVELVGENSRNVLPSCLRCGECCRRGSPTLHLDDIEILHRGSIPWRALTTLRRGEPVRSPYQGKPFFLVDERIKLKEKPGTNTCLFLNEASNECRIHRDRPLQCRAQACWDPAQAEELQHQAYLTRRDLFKEVELLLDLIREHDIRCSFDQLNAAFQRIETSEQDAVDELFRLISYEGHFRRFVAEKLSLPEEILDLVFGRSFTELLPLFGCRLEVRSDGTRYLVVEGHDR